VASGKWQGIRDKGAWQRDYNRYSFTGHAETAHNRIASVVVGFKEALLEEAEKKKDNRK